MIPGSQVNFSRPTELHLFPQRSVILNLFFQVIQHFQCSGIRKLLEAIIKSTTLSGSPRPHQIYVCPLQEKHLCSVAHTSCFIRRTGTIKTHCLFQVPRVQTSPDSARMMCCLTNCQRPRCQVRNGSFFCFLVFSLGIPLIDMPPCGGEGASL